MDAIACGVDAFLTHHTVGKRPHTITTDSLKGNVSCTTAGCNNCTFSHHAPSLRVTMRRGVQCESQGNLPPRSMMLGAVLSELLLRERRDAH